jgi:hypothetical protein
MEDAMRRFAAGAALGAAALGWAAGSAAQAKPPSTFHPPSGFSFELVLDGRDASGAPLTVKRLEVECLGLDGAPAAQ